MFDHELSLSFSDDRHRVFGLILVLYKIMSNIHTQFTESSNCLFSLNCPSIHSSVTSVVYNSINHFSSSVNQQLSADILAFYQHVHMTAAVHILYTLVCKVFKLSVTTN